MAETYGALIERVFELVEGSLRAPLTLEGIAEAVGLSPYHLHRVVRALSGRSLISYLRGRRLSASLRDLLETDRRVIDIAQDYCFAYEQSYIRAFGKQFSMSPGEYRRRRPEVPVVEPIGSRSYSFLGENGIVVRPRLVLKPACAVVGIRRAVDLAENAERSLVTELANEAYELRSSAVGVPALRDTYAGIVQYSGDPSFNWYVAGFEAPAAPAEPPPSPFVVVDLPSCRCVSFSWISRFHPRHLQWADVAELYRRIFAEYMPSSPYSFPYPWHLETVDLASCAEDYGEFRVLLPVGEGEAVYST